MEEFSSVTVTLASSEADLPDGWILPPEVQRFVLESGYNANEMIEEIFDWYERRVVPVLDAA
jgi:hypothetical protein